MIKFLGSITLLDSGSPARGITEFPYCKGLGQRFRGKPIIHPQIGLQIQNARITGFKSESCNPISSAIRYHATYPVSISEFSISLVIYSSRFRNASP